MDSTLTTNDSASRPRGARLAAYLALAYLLLIVYASLTPFSGWRDSGADVWSFLFVPWSRHIRREPDDIEVYCDRKWETTFALQREQAEPAQAGTAEWQAEMRALIQARDDKRDNLQAAIEALGEVEDQMQAHIDSLTTKGA